MGDMVIWLYVEGVVWVQFWVGQVVICWVCGIWDVDIQICCGGVNVGQFVGGVVVVILGLVWVVDVDEFVVVVSGVIVVRQQVVQVLVL